MAIDRAPWNALVDDDGSNLVGTVWNKDKIKTVILDPVDAALASSPTEIPSGGATADVLTRDLAVPTFGSKWAPINTVVDVPFNAASYGVYPAGSWTVTSGNVASFVKSVTGKIGLVSFDIRNSVIAGTPLLLSVVCPLVGPRRTISTARIALTSGTLELGGCYFEIADGRIYLQRIAGNWPAGTLAEVSITIPLLLA